MNKQHPPNGIEWTRIHGRPGYTANPIRGCMHDCKWEMPDGTIAGCYAKAIVEKFGQKAYPQGFEHLSFHENELKEIGRRRECCGIFIDSMSDMFGAKVPEEWIQRVLETMRACPQHVFFVLTKQPGRLRGRVFPRNVWVGISAPPTFMFGHRLTQVQQRLWFFRGLEALSDCEAGRKWVSIEPLTLNLVPELGEFREVLTWAVIGGASDGAKTFQPDRVILRHTLAALGAMPYFCKGNLDPAVVHAAEGRYLQTWPPIL